MSRIVSRRPGGKRAVRIVASLAALALLALGANLLLRGMNPNREIRIADASASVGGVVEVPVTIKGNPGIAAFVLQVDFDESYLEAVDVVQSDMITNGSFLSNLALEKRTPERVSILWADVSDLEGDGQLCTLTFRVKQDAPQGIPLTLTYRSGDIANSELESVEFRVVSAKIDTI